MSTPFCSLFLVVDICLRSCIIIIRVYIKVTILILNGVTDRVLNIGSKSGPPAVITLFHVMCEMG